MSNPRRILKTAGVTLSIGLAVMSCIFGLNSEIRKKYVGALKEALEKEGWRRATVGVPPVDAGTLYLLGRKRSENSKKTPFTIRPYNEEFDVEVLKVVKLNREQATKVRESWVKQEFGRKIGALSHLPQYGIRLEAGKRTVLQTSVDVEAGTFWYHVGLGNTETGGWAFWTEQGKELQLLLKDLTNY